jgi:RNA polymerase sigma factor for flagellar operon FliA
LTASLLTANTDGASAATMDIRAHRYLDGRMEVADALWERWLSSRDSRAREELVRRYWPLVRSAAAAAKRPKHLGTDELVSHASLGLLAALDRYDPSKGPFEAYARARMRGAIIDGIRDHDRSSRVNLERSKALAATTDRLTARLHRAPTDAELAVGLGVAESKIGIYHDSRAATTVGTFDASGADLDDDHAASEGDKSSWRDLLDQAGAHDDVTVEVEHRLRQEALAAALNRIDGPDRAVMVLYYCEEMTMAEIATVLGVATARVSQIHSRAVRALKDNLQPALPSLEDQP